jgi:hypothetical protein
MLKVENLAQGGKSRVTAFALQCQPSPVTMLMWTRLAFFRFFWNTKVREWSVNEREWSVKGHFKA